MAKKKRAAKKKAAKKTAKKKGRKKKGTKKKARRKAKTQDQEGHVAWRVFGLGVAERSHWLSAAA